MPKKTYIYLGLIGTVLAGIVSFAFINPADISKVINSRLSPLCELNKFFCNLTLKDKVIDEKKNTATILSESVPDGDFIFAVNVESFFRENANFSKDVDIKGTLSAPNLFQGVNAGTGISVTGADNNPTLSNTGVLSFQGQTGAVNLTGNGITISGTTLTNTGVLSFQGQTGEVTLTKGSGIGISGATISNTGVLSLQDQTGALNLTAGTGISISGLGITNNDPGSSQNIFKQITVGGTSFSASSNTDTITFASGSGIIITPNTTNKLLTISSTGVSESTQWTQSDSSGTIYPNNSTLDVLLGGSSTSSAKFNFINNASGTPTASISANSGNNSLYITGNGTLATTNRQTLTLGSATTGNIAITNNAIFNGNLTLGGDTFSNFTGNGLSVTSNVLNLDLLSSSDSAGLTNSRSGLEITGSTAQLSLLQGCSNNQLLDRKSVV
jgi:hypothetical protein